MSTYADKTEAKDVKDMSIYYHGKLRQEFVEDMLKEIGDFLIRKSTEGPPCVSVKTARGTVHCQPTISGCKFTYGDKEFRTMDELVYFHWKKGVPLNAEGKPILKQPIKHRKRVYKKDDVEIVKKLGEGNFGEVFKVRIKSEAKTYAMKMLRDNVSKEIRESFRVEMNMMATMRHENVVQCYGTVEDEQEICILLELINSGSLDKLLRKGKVRERGKSRIVTQVAKGMAYLHGHQIIHRDLASRNILIHRNDDGTIVAKVSDFGLSRRDETGKGYELRNAQKLPLKWMAPECLLKCNWTAASDVWSFGVLMWEVYSNGKDPYADIDFDDQVEKLTKYISDGGHPSHLKDVPSQINDLMLLCWTLDVDKRPTMENMVEKLETIFPPVDKPPCTEGTDSVQCNKKK